MATNALIDELEVPFTLNLEFEAQTVIFEFILKNCAGSWGEISFNRPQSASPSAEKNEGDNRVFRHSTRPESNSF